jgi:hypothetical protein
MDRFNYEVKEARSFAGIKEQVYRITRKDGKATITPSDIRNLVNAIEREAEKKGEIIRMMVRAWNGAGQRTYKGYDGNLDMQDEDEYFEGKVRDSSKFSLFSQVEIYIMKQIK